MSKDAKTPIIHKQFPLPAGVDRVQRHGVAPQAFDNPQQMLHNRFMKVVQQSVSKQAGACCKGGTCSTATKKAPEPSEENKALVSRYTHIDPESKLDVLAPRKKGAPSILEECKTPIRLIVRQKQAPGDIVMLTAAIRDLHSTYPGKFITCMKTTCEALWHNNPYHTQLDEKEAGVMQMHASYTAAIGRSNTDPHHFIHGFRLDLEAKLGLPITPGPLKGDIHLTPQEKVWLSQVYEINGKNIPFWIIDAGTKSDFTNKQWEGARYQGLVERFPEITFVQIGAKAATHRHPPLTGDNIINLVGKTDLRQVVRLMYHAAGVITPVSFPMHLSAAVSVHPRYKRTHRPCIAIAGGREPSVWEAYSNHQYIHNCGSLPCCSNGGCWKSRIEPVGDGDKKDYDGMCERPIIAESGQTVPKCMDMISVDMVEGAMRMYLEAYEYTEVDEKDWKVSEYKFPEAVAQTRLAMLTKLGKKAENEVGKGKVDELKRTYKACLPAAQPVKRKRTPVKKKKAPTSRSR